MVILRLPAADMDCTLDVDITLQSSDCYRYKTHSKNLALYCDAFPAVGSVTIDENEVVQMAESREIVSLLIKFMHRGYQPDLSNVGFETLSALAEAVEKYVVFSAIPVCKAKMRCASIRQSEDTTVHMKSRDAIDEHPVEVFLYAIRHGHQELRDLSARETFHIPLLDLARMVGQVAPEACISLVCSKTVPWLGHIVTDTFHVDALEGQLYRTCKAALWQTKSFFSTWLLYLARYTKIFTETTVVCCSFQRGIRRGGEKLFRVSRVMGSVEGGHQKQNQCFTCVGPVEGARPPDYS